MSFRRMMQVFYNLLYHPFAFSYDLVAWIVSFGNWKEWVYTTLPFIDGARILELGHGPGHLQRLLIDGGRHPCAIDESAQMGRIAKAHLGCHQKLTQGLVQSLPFRSGYFDTVVSTFPTEYIFERQSLSEVSRVLRKKGRLIVLPAAWPRNGFLKWLYRVTGETPSEISKVLIRRFEKPFGDAEFETAFEMIEVKSSSLLIIKAYKR